MRRILAAATLAALYAAAPAAQSPTRFETLAAFAEAKMKEHRVPGVSLGIVDNGIVTTRGLGITNVEDPLPVTDHTVFPIASISKTFAATAVMRLVEQGKIDLKAPVRKYLPGFTVRDADVARDVTIWNLLTHSGGWEGQIAGPERGEDTLRHFVATTMADVMQVAPLDSARGEPRAAVWSYNNAGYSLAGHVIEVVNNTSINRAMRDLVFTPLGLAHAGTTAGDFIVNRFASGHVNRAGESSPSLIRPYVHATSVTSGGIGVCIADLMTYAKFHLGDGTNAKGERILSRASLDLMQTPQLEKQSTDDAIGLGWHIRRVGGVRVAGQGGTAGGHILVLSIVPERNFAIGILTNVQNGWRLIEEVEREALRAYHGIVYAKNQAIAHRGLVETLPNVEPLATQPDPKPYVGRYQRPMNAVDVRIENSKLVVQEMPNSGEARPPMPIAFFGHDRAVITDGTARGQSIEFIRDATGVVKWVRVVGRVAVRTTDR